MGNSKSGLGLGNIIIDLSKPNAKVIFEGDAYDVIAVDNDLSENEDYFRDDTLDLGYDNEAQRIVNEAMEDRGIKTLEQINEAFGIIFGALSEQEYFNNCEYEVSQLDKDKFLIIYAYGGRYSDDR